MRQHTSDCRQRRTAVEQFVSHKKNLSRKEDEKRPKLRRERKGEKKMFIDSDIYVVILVSGILKIYCDMFRVCVSH